MSGGSASTNRTPRNRSISSIVSGELSTPTTTSAPSSATPVAASVQPRLRRSCVPVAGAGRSFHAGISTSSAAVAKSSAPASAMTDRAKRS